MRRRLIGAVASTITKITSARQIVLYLSEQTLDIAEYLAEGEQRKPLIWGGEGATAVGLVGVADVDDVVRVLRGVDPDDLDSDRIVVREPPKGSKQQRVMAFENSFAPPKSWSVWWAIADDETRAKLEACHERAVQEALGALEERLPYARIRAGEGMRRWVRGTGLLMTRVRHESSRAGDPQLHDHVLVMNMVFAEGKWRAIDGTRVYDARCRANNEYARTLQIETIRELGVELTEASGKNLIREIAGVPTVLTAFYSKRHNEIKHAVAEHAARTGIAGGGGARRIASERTRSAKDLTETRADKRARWRAESLTVLAAADARRRGANAVTVAAFVAAALWREAGGDADRFAGAVRAAEAVGEVPEFGAAAAAGALAATRVADGRPADAASVALGALQGALEVPEGLSVAEAGGDPDELALVAAEAARATRRSLDEFTSRARRGNTPGTWDRHAVIAAALEHLTARTTHWDYDHLLEVLEEVTATAGADVTVSDLYELADAMLASDQTVGIAVAGAGGGADGNDRRPGWQRWATRATIEREQRVMQWITAGTNDQWRTFTTPERAEARRRLAEAGLSDEQAEAALALVCRRIGILTADGPGAGKTATMAGVALLAPLGQAVVGLAVTEKATRELAAKADIPAANIARALHAVDAVATARSDTERQRRLEAVQEVLPAGGCWIIDEASMVNTIQLERLGELARHQRAQVIIAGDPAQLDPIEGGSGIFDAAVARVEIPTERLVTIHRPRDAWEAPAWKALTAGDEAALGDFAAHGRFVGIGAENDDATNATSAIDEIVAMWTAATADEAPAVDDDTPEGVRRVAARRAAKRDDARHEIAHQGHVDPSVVTAGDLEGTDKLTPLAIAFTNTDVDALNQALRDATNPPPAAPAKPKRGRPRKPLRDHAEVHWVDEHGHQHTWQFRVGDTVMTTRNDHTIVTTEQKTIANSRRWRLTAISGDRLKLASLDGEGLVELPASYWQRCDSRTGRPHLQLGYAATIYRSQSATVDLTLCLDSHHLNKPSLLVALTRAQWGGYLIGEGTDRDVHASAIAAHRRLGNLSAAVEAHRLGVQAGGLTPEQAAEAGFSSGAPRGLDI